MNPLQELQMRITDSLSRVARVERIDDYVRVTSHCMYPSNGLVTVSVRGSTSVTISDEGGAMSEISAAGIPARLTDRQVAGLVSTQGLKVNKGVIYSPSMPLDAVAAGIVLVANASKEVAEWHYQHSKIRVPRDFKRALATILQNTFAQKLEHEIKIPGQRKAHTFANVVHLDGGIRMIVDPVEREQSSISARVVANIDVRDNNDPTVKQRLVYDDEADWSPDDLNLLGIAGVPIIAFSSTVQNIQTVVHG